MHLSGGVRLSEVGVSKLGATVRPASKLAFIINMGLTKPKLVFWL